MHPICSNEAATDIQPLTTSHWLPGFDGNLRKIMRRRLLRDLVHRHAGGEFDQPEG